MLISRIQHSIPVDSITLGGWVEKLADAMNKHGWVNVVQDPQNQTMYPAVLSSLDAMVSDSIIVASDYPTIDGGWNGIEEILKACGPDSIQCFLEVPCSNCAIEVGWRSTDPPNPITGFSVGISTDSRMVEDRRSLFSQLIQHSELSKAVRILDTQHGFKVEPMVDSLGVRCQISMGFGLNPSKWAVCGFRNCDSVVAIAKELQQNSGSSSNVRRLSFYFPQAKYEKWFAKLSPYSSAWEVHYHGHMHPDAIAYLENGGTTKFTCIPIVTWMREFREDGLEPRFNVDVVPDGEKAVFVLTSQATDEKQITTMLKKRLPKEFLSLFN
ncbi:MAG: hypothetical protein LW870_23685 [Pirellula sp.]|jgi:hypothetical protein|nr:hypothetical protein [Pirellula sp.]